MTLIKQTITFAQKKSPTNYSFFIFSIYLCKKIQNREKLIKINYLHNEKDITITNVGMGYGGWCAASDIDVIYTATTRH